jgi:hypothetical protein
MTNDDLEVFLDSAPLFSSAERADIVARRETLRKEPRAVATSGDAAGAVGIAASHAATRSDSTVADGATAAGPSDEEMAIAEGKLTSFFSSMDPFARRRGSGGVSSPAHASPASGTPRERLNGAHARVRRVQREAAATSSSPASAPRADSSQPQSPAAGGYSSSSSATWATDSAFGSPRYRATPTGFHATTTANSTAAAAASTAAQPAAATASPFYRVKTADTGSPLNSSLFGSIGDPLSGSVASSSRRLGSGGSLGRSPVNDAARYRLQKLRAFQTHNGGGSTLR